MANPKTPPVEAVHDEVAEGVHETVVFLQKHYLSILGAAFLVLVGILVFNSMENSRARIASEINTTLVACIDQVREIEQATDPAQRTSIAKKASADLDKIIAQYPDNALTLQAVYLKGRIAYELDDFENAQKSYTAYIAKAPNAEAAARGQIALGYTYENHSFLVGDQKQQADLLQSAYGEYKKAADGAGQGAYLYSYALMNMARCLDALHKSDEAMKLYQQVIDLRPAPYVASAPDDGAKVSDDGTPAPQSENDFLRQMLNKNQAIISFRETAKLRLDSLKGEAAQPKAQPAGVASGAAAATPATASAATTAAATISPAK